MKFRQLIILTILIFGGLVFIINEAFLYTGIPTHSNLTREIALFYNYYYDSDLSSSQIEWMRQGSINEDTWPRNWYYHFYDPVYNRGFGPLSAKEWAQNSQEQAKYPGGDHSWQKAISDYNSGHKKEAFISLGHILHLIEDMAVPAHTREDPHPDGDSLEKWAADLSEYSAFYNIAIPLTNQGIKPKVFNNLDAYFDEVANFSNNNFFSKDTISETINKYGGIKLDAKYSTPRIVKEGWENGKEYAYGKVNDSSILIRLAEIGRSNSGKKNYFLDNNTPEIHADYFSLLSKEAVINGAGIIKLFFDSAEESEKEIVESETKLSLFDKIINEIKKGAKFVYSVFYGLFHIPFYAIDSVIDSVTPDSEYLATNPWVTEEIKSLSPVSIDENQVQDELKLPQETFYVSRDAGQIQIPKNAENAETIENTDNTDNQEEVQQQEVIQQTTKEIFIVKRVIDGDTIVLENGQQVRYIGINAPELPNGCFAQQATEKNKELVEGKEVRLEKDVSETDDYGRLLRYVYADSLFINDYLVRNGYAYDLAYNPDIKYKEKLADTEQQARDNRRGLWGDICHPSGNSGGGGGGSAEQEQSFPPIESGQVVINEIAWMGTNADHNDEWIELYNTASQSIDLTNSVLEAEDGSPSITLIGSITANGYYLLERMDDETISNISADQIYAGALENDGERLILKDSHGNVINQVNCSGGWYAGNNEENRTMERTQEGWQTYFGSGSDAVDADGNLVLGTPRTENSIDAEEPEQDEESERDEELDEDEEPEQNEELDEDEEPDEDLIPALDYNYASFSFSIIINEIAWMGTNADHNDEWIELYNKTDYNINLAGLILEAADGTPIIYLTEVIPANGYYLLERTSDKTISNITASQFYTGALNNHGENLVLKDSDGNIIDEIDCSNNWYAGQNTKEEGEWARRTMERINVDEPGTDSENWQAYSGSGSGAIDAGGNPILGTPKTENSINNEINEENDDENNQEDNNIYRIYTPIDKDITKDTTWMLEDSPYLIYDRNKASNELLEIAEGATLTIEPGVIVKFKNPGLKVFGTIKIEGTSKQPIVFTNYNDDEYGGNIFEDKDNSQYCRENPKDSSKCPYPGFWSGIWFTESSNNSVLDNIIIRYAGSRTRPFRTGSSYSPAAVGAAIRTENTSIILRNSIIENNLFKGVWLENSPNTIVENSIFQNHLEEDNIVSGRPEWHKNIAVYIDSSNPQIKNSTFQNNLTGIYLTNNSQSIVENNYFSDNSYPIWVNNSYPQFSNNQIDNNHWNGIVLYNLELNQNYILRGDSVFINKKKVTIPVGYTLTIEPGTIIKSVYKSEMTVEGTLIAEGTTEKPIIFTSFYDDEYGGDTNGDNEGTKDNAMAGSWGQIVFKSTSTNSSLNYIIVRYGGTIYRGSATDQPDYALKIEGSDLILANSIIEDNTGGFYMENSNSQIVNTIFQNHQYTQQWSYFTSTGLSLVSSNSTIDSATFLNNKWGIYIDANSWPILTNLNFTENNKDVKDMRPEPESSVEIIDIFYDGIQDGEADEYVEIKNNRETAQNLDGWTLSDEASHSYTFPSYDLEPNQSIKVYTNMSAESFNYGSGAAIWNNDGDTAYLEDDNNNLIDTYNY